MWAVIYSVQGGWKTHSVHARREKAVVWAECISHDGDKDAAVLEITAECADEVVTLEASTRS